VRSKPPTNSKGDVIVGHQGIQRQVVSYSWLRRTSNRVE
jgi:hypothetical protein